MAEVDFTRRRRTPGLEAPTQDIAIDVGGAPAPPPLEPPKVPGAQPPSNTGGPSPSGPTTLPSNPLPPNVPIGNTGFSTLSNATGFDPSRVPQGVDLEWAQRFFATDPGDYHRMAEQYAGGRGNDTSGRLHDSQGPAYNQRTNQLNQGFMGGPMAGWDMTFDDPWTAQLERLLAQQMEMLNRPNPQLEQLTNFLNSQFRSLSEAPGYSPEELAVLRTQAFEPVEAYRNASKQRALERASSRGMLPSSGLHELDTRDIEMAADRNRTALDRDLAVNQIGERNRDLANAANVATQAYQIPWADQMQRMADTLSRSSLLYELPQRAQQSAMSVINGTPGPESLFNQLLNQAGFQQGQYQFDAQRQSQLWSSIGQIIANWGRG